MTPDELRELSDTSDCPYVGDSREGRANGHEWDELWCCLTCLETKLEALCQRREREAAEKALDLCQQKSADELAERRIPIAYCINQAVLSEMFPPSG